MSEFEKKTLAYVILWVYFLAVFGTRSGVLGMKNYAAVVFCVATPVCLILFTFFELWSVGNGYFRENDLTEREKFLYYKSSTRAVFTFFTMIMSLGCGYVFINNHEIELTIKNANFVQIVILFMIAFAAIQSLILFIYLRNERLRDCQTQPEPQESETHSKHLKNTGGTIESMNPPNK